MTPTQASARSQGFPILGLCSLYFVASLLIPVPESEKEALKHAEPGPDAPKPGSELEPSKRRH